MNRKIAMLIALWTALFCLAPAAWAEELPAAGQAPPPTPSALKRPAGYMVLKAGIYSPSEKFDLETINGGQFETIDPKTGFDGELAFGYYFAPVFATELSAGYFHSKGSPTTGTGETKLDVVPVLLTAKLLLPIGPIEPYAEAGGGVYITQFKGTGDLENFHVTTKAGWGWHAGAGVNLFLAPTFFIGAEGRYIWAEPKFRDERVKLNGFTVTGNIGFLL